SFLEMIGKNPRHPATSHSHVIPSLSYQHSGEDGQESRRLSRACGEKGVYAKRQTRTRRESGSHRQVAEGGFPAGPRPCNGHLRPAQGDESRNRSLRQDRELIEPHLKASAPLQSPDTIFTDGKGVSVDRQTGE